MAKTRGLIVNRAGFDAAPLNEIAQKLTPGEMRVPGFTPVLYGPNFQITLEPGKTMSGIVRDPQGNPVAGAIVEALPSWGIHVSFNE